MNRNYWAGVWYAYALILALIILKAFRIIYG